MKKIKAISFILAACMASIFTASCGNTETTSGNNGEKVEISVVSSERSSMEIMQRLIDKYNAEHYGLALEGIKNARLPHQIMF